MRHMLATCERFAEEFHVTFTFNPEKTKCVIFAPRKPDRQYCVSTPVFQVNNEDIENIQRWLHLGHVFSCDLSDRDDTAKRRNVWTSK